MSPVRTEPRRPGAFRLDDPAVEMVEEAELEALEPEQADAHKAVEAIAHPRRRGIPWGALALSTGSALVPLALGLALDALVRDLYSPRRLARLAGPRAHARLPRSACSAWSGAKSLGLFRLKRLARLRLAATTRRSATTATPPSPRTRKLIAFYGGRPDTAMARRRVAGHLGEIMDGRDLLMLAERDLIAPLDQRAKALASAAARRVSVVTAVSPRAFVDVAFVLWECVRLIRRIAALYGGRPGTIGLFRLMKAVVSHLAVTGSIAVGDTILQQLIGHGLAGRLSAKLGEGVVNGLMTARIGLSAMDVCRPLPFLGKERPRLKDLTGDLLTPRESG